MNKVDKIVSPALTNLHSKLVSKGPLSDISLNIISTKNLNRQSNCAYNLPLDLLKDNNLFEEKTKKSTFTFTDT